MADLREHPYADFLRKVEKPARYSAASTARRARTGTRVERARLPRVPRRLRHRDEPPRLQDPLQDPERRTRDARRALLRAVGRHGGRAARARAAAASRSRRARAARLRRGRLLAAVRAHVHQHPHDARSRRHPAARARSRRGRSAGHRRRPDRDAPRAARAVHRRLRDRRRRRAHAARSRSPGRELQARGRAARRAPARSSPQLGGVYVPSLYDDRARSRHRLAVVDARARPGRAAARSQRALVADINKYPVPRRRPGRRPRGHLRSHVDRDRARLHRGLPLLPGRHDLPPRARARSGGDRRHGRAAPCKKAATTRRRSPRSRPPTTRASRR